MKFEIQNPVGVPVGNYRAKFAAVRRVPFDDGFAVRFIFNVVEGPYAGVAAKRLAPELASPTNTTGRLVAGITGEVVSPKTTVDIEPYLGQVHEIEVEAMPNGTGTRVAAVSPLSR